MVGSIGWCHRVDVLDPSPVLTGAAPAFAVLHRASSPSVVDVFKLGGSSRSWLADVPLPDLSEPDGPDVLVLVPYRQLTCLLYTSPSPRD